MTLRSALPAALLAAALAWPAAAQVYTWTDAEGTVHFGEEPPPQGTRHKKVRLPDDPPPPQAEEAQAQAQAQARAEPRPAPQGGQPARARSAAPRAAPRVDLYSTSWCKWCTKARAWFQARGISYTDHDIEADGAALERRLALGGGQGVPVAVIGGKVVKGYAPAQYEAALQAR